MHTAHRHGNRTRSLIWGSLLILCLAAPLTLGAARLGAGASAARAASVSAVAADPVIATAGDIACSPSNSHFNGGNGVQNACRQKATSDLLVAGNYAAVLPLGDNQYECGSLWAFQNSYDLSWGRVKSITRPSPGNHDYLTHGGTDCTSANAGAAGYYGYFGTLAGTVAPGKGYYSYDIGSWHLISLNSNCSDAGGCGPTTPQGKWLLSDLAAHAGQCILAYWHIPLYSSGGRASKNSQSFWNALYAAHADLILNGHDHIYERFAPQNPSGGLDNVAGIREIIAGTGGNNHTSIATVQANSQVRDTTTFGILEVTLHAGSYDWRFVPDTGSGSFTDSGSGTCHNASTDHTPPSDPTGLSATGAGSTEVDLSWTGSTDDTGVAGYRIFRNGEQVGTSTTTSYADTGLVPGTAYSYQVSAYDAANNQSALSNTTGASTAPDSTPPTTPTGLTAAPGATSGIDLSWGRSTDDSGIDHYSVFRDGTQIDTVVSSANRATYTYSDTAVLPGSTHTYVVEAVDVAGNVSPDSNQATATAPNTITVTPVADTWVQDTTPTTNYGSNAAIGTDGSPVKHILLTFNVSGLLGRPVVSAKLRLYCVDPSGLGGEFHRLPNTSWSESSVTWNSAPAADPAVLGTLASVTTGNWYEVDVTSALSGDGPVSFEALSTSTNGADYSSKEGAVGFAPHLVITTTATGGDTSPPTAPGNLAATGVSSSEIDLSWSAATDNNGVDHYDVLRDNVKVGSATGLSFQDTGLAANTSYDYVVRAVDAVGNLSPDATKSASTLADTTDPSTPGGVVATPVAANQIDLSWTASTDDVGVDHYAIQRDGQPLATVPGSATSFSDTGVQPSTPYAYTVEAFDAAGNSSGQSSPPATATTPAPPSSLTFNPDADSYVNASSPTSNYGSATSLRIDGSPVVRSYLRFTVQGVIGTVTKATLRVHANSSSSTGHQVSGVADNGWSENTINYNNAPALGGVIGSTGGFSSGTWTEVDVTPYIAGNGTYSLAVATASSTAVSYASSESTNPPELVLEVGP
jgi:chitodextrinase